MKKFYLAGLLLFLFCGLGFSQSRFSKMVESDSLSNWEERDYNWDILGADDDTSEKFTDCEKYQDFGVFWRVTDTTGNGTDSVAIYIVLQGSHDLTNWINLDSIPITSSAAVADSFGYKSFSAAGAGIKSYQIRVNGLSSNSRNLTLRMIYYARKKGGIF